MEKWRMERFSIHSLEFRMRVSTWLPKYFGRKEMYESGGMSGKDDKGLKECSTGFYLFRNFWAQNFSQYCLAHKTRLARSALRVDGGLLGVGLASSACHRQFVLNFASALQSIRRCYQRLPYDFSAFEYNPTHYLRCKRYGIDGGEVPAVPVTRSLRLWDIDRHI